MEKQGDLILNDVDISAERSAVCDFLPMMFLAG